MLIKVKKGGFPRGYLCTAAIKLSGGSSELTF